MGVFASVFATLPAIAGFIGGLQYPLATHLVHSYTLGKYKTRRVRKITESHTLRVLLRGRRRRFSRHSEEEKGATRPAGALYALDAFGAALGALLTGVFFIPLYGIFAVAFLCVAINGAVFILLYPAKLSPDV